ncbi:MAG: hypothetical protein H0T71_04600 [Acidobacteria bacterium]|nr:hypothetical protein [Acidobacteriota bacterium]
MSQDRRQAANGKRSDGPPNQVQPTPHKTGNAAAGKEVFRFETFGNEGFWTDAARMPKGIEDKKVTPLQALEAGLIVDIDAVPPDMRAAMAKELKTDLSPQQAPMLNDVKTTVKLIEANAVVGMIPKDSNGDGKISIAAGDKVGVSCAICHTISDKSVFDMPGKGSIGKRIDGPAALVLNMGKLFATADNSRALFPNLQIEHEGKTIGRAPKGLTAKSTEAEVDAYLENPAFYPVGTFDETQDGHGNPVTNQPLFRQDLAGPYGSAGEHALLDGIGNGSYTTNLDPTTLVTPEGRQFLKLRAGKAGEAMANAYQQILDETGVKGYPFVKATKVGNVGDPASPVGLRVDNQKLFDMNAYLDSLPAPKGAKVDAKTFAAGRATFRTNCTSCHNVDQSKFVPTMLVDMKTIVPDYKPMVLGERQPPMTPVQNSAGTFDDKMIVIDASDRGEKRGNAMPLLLDLARKQVFLHDASVNGLDALLDPQRGASAPHPFYIADQIARSNVVEFLRGVDTEQSGKTP